MTVGWLTLTLGLRFALGASTPAFPSAPLPSGGEPLPPNTPIHVGLLLNVGNPEAAKAEQREVLRTRQRARVQDADAAMGQSDENVARIKRWLRANGLTPSDIPSHMLVEAEGTAAQVGRAFGTRLKKLPKKPATVHWPDPKPKLPEWLEPLVERITGLDTRPLPSPKKPRH